MLKKIKAFICGMFKKEVVNTPYKLEPKNEFPEPMESDAVQTIKTTDLDDDSALEFKARELRNNGKSYRNIAEELKTTEYRIKKLLKKK
jgi:hypothetical protein